MPYQGIYDSAHCLLSSTAALEIGFYGFSLDLGGLCGAEPGEFLDLVTS